MARTAVISDIHGCVDEFEELLKLLDLHAGVDRFVSVGDVVDKGPDSVGAIRAVRAAERRYPGSCTVLGNHEAKWLKKMKRGEPLPTVPGEFRQDDADWMASLPLFRRFPEHGLFVCHAGLFPSLYWKEDHGGIGALREGDEVWGRGGKRAKLIEKIIYARFVDERGDFLSIDKEAPGMQHWTQVYDGRDGFVVGGHEPTREVLEGPSGMGIDTGCVFGGKLTAVVFEGGPGWRPTQVVEVAAKRAYCERVRWHQDKGHPGAGESDPDG